ncbi:MAG: FKBP-type peptidyl-prolyl cis-trans isomerase [Bacteroidetes bacterium]|nr:FKBP-type peptidyl-prolyl cis-trans isomerase [Bacteroidota bacterium]
MRFHFIIFFIGPALVWLTSCGPSAENKQQAPVDKEKLKQQFIKANQQVLQKENDEMDYYQKTHQLQFINTGSGLRYFVYKASAKGDSIREGDVVTMNYTVSLMDGTECYSSGESGPKEFMVGQDDLESGIHKGVQLIKAGDKCLFMIPSHMAHGLLGDYKKIPPQSPIVYDVEILSVKKASHE